MLSAHFRLSPKLQPTTPKAPTWLYFAIPFISGFVGWITNVLALHMTFYPIEFKGVKVWQPEGQPFGFFGWQVRTTLATLRESLSLNSPMFRLLTHGFAFID